jgi:hypothetical protein
MRPRGNLAALHDMLCGTDRRPQAMSRIPDFAKFKRRVDMPGLKVG